MAAVGHSITPEAFALAITDLPLENIYAKAAELQNSISHLLSSNVQMQPFAEEGDSVCVEAIRENDAVIGRMEERIGLCKAEVEKRGMLWMGSAAAPTSNNDAEPLVNGIGHSSSSSAEDAVRPAQQPSGRLTDEQLRQQLESQLGGGDDDDEAGIHL